MQKIHRDGSTILLKGKNPLNFEFVNSLPVPVGFDLLASLVSGELATHREFSYNLLGAMGESIVLAINSILGVFLRVFLKRHRLEKIKMLDLGASLDAAIKLYGQPVESSPYEQIPFATKYGFVIIPFHAVTIAEWDGKIQMIVYSSSPGDPGRDLTQMFKKYRNGLKWNCMSDGPEYRREDEVFDLWCSALPVIGVATRAHREALQNQK